jgi:RHS repeat-associated protein
VRSSNANGVSVDHNYDTLNRLSSVLDNRRNKTTTYAYDNVGNLQSYAYANGVHTTHTFDALNRLTNLSSAKGAALSSYTYTLGAAGNRENVAELSGRVAAYTYDDLYRLKTETISNDFTPANNGTISYTYDKVGNRLTRTTNIAPIPNQSFGYDLNDRLNSDTYDNNGSTTQSEGKVYTYDFENRILSVNGNAVTFVYDGDGNRVVKTLGGTTNLFLVDTNNLTGYAQVFEEIHPTAGVQRTYVYGADLISQDQLIAGVWTESFYGYDGHGSVRQLTNAAGAITDLYDYDAFGNLINQSGNTPNLYLYCGEQFDLEMGFYYLRSRYMTSSTGRFWTMDSYESGLSDPKSLHKYASSSNNAVNMIDPTGQFSIGSMMTTTGIQNTITTATGHLSTLYKAYQFASNAITAVEYASYVINIMSAFAQPSASAVISAIEAELLKSAKGFSLSNVVSGLAEMFNQIGPRWSEIARSIVQRAPQIAAETATAAAGRVAGYARAEAEGRAKLVFFSPTSPLGRSGGDVYIPVGNKLEIGINSGGGRLFGIGVRLTASMVEQVLRIDYWDVRSQAQGRPTPTNLHLHYHIYSDGHPPGRTIWP